MFGFVLAGTGHNAVLRKCYTTSMPNHAEGPNDARHDWAWWIRTPIVQIWCLCLLSVLIWVHPVAVDVLGQAGWVDERQATLVSRTGESGTTNYTEHGWSLDTYTFVFDDHTQTSLTLDEYAARPDIHEQDRVTLGYVMGAIATINGQPEAPAGFFTLMAFGMSCWLLALALVLTIAHQKHNARRPISVSNSLVYALVLLLMGVPVAFPALLVGLLLDRAGAIWWPLALLGIYALIGVMTARRLKKPRLRPAEQ
jgi:hypothetical protein